MMTRVRAWLSGVVLAVGVLASNALAQRGEAAGERVTTGVTKAGVDSLKRAVGMRVRLRDVTSPSWQYGTLGAADAEFVLLRGRRDDTKIQNKDLIAAQRSLGKARFNPTFAGFAIGLFGGGAIGFAVDLAAFLAARALLPDALARLIALLIAVTATWWLNRRVTFRSADPNLAGEWLRYAATSAVGAGTNACISLVLLWNYPRIFTVVALAAGSIGALLVNFCLARTFAYRTGSSVPPRSSPY